MAFQLSPGVNFSEVDLTTVVPSVASSDGAIAGIFKWGPIGERVLIDSENLLAQRFGNPTNSNPETFFTAANFLAYGNRLYVSRAGKTTGATPQVYANTTDTGDTTFSNVFTCTTTSLLIGRLYAWNPVIVFEVDAKLFDCILLIPAKTDTTNVCWESTNQLVRAQCSTIFSVLDNL